MMATYTIRYEYASASERVPITMFFRSKDRTRAMQKCNRKIRQLKKQYGTLQIYLQVQESAIVFESPERAKYVQRREPIYIPNPHCKRGWTMQP